jgi:hypothetical protein
MNIDVIFEIKIFDKWVRVKSTIYELCRSEKRIRNSKPNVKR